MQYMIIYIFIFHLIEFNNNSKAIFFLCVFLSFFWSLCVRLWLMFVLFFGFLHFLWLWCNIWCNHKLGKEADQQREGWKQGRRRWKRRGAFPTGLHYVTVFYFVSSRHTSSFKVHKVLSPPPLLSAPSLPSSFSLCHILSLSLSLPHLFSSSASPSSLDSILSNSVKGAMCWLLLAKWGHAASFIQC